MDFNKILYTYRRAIVEYRKDNIGMMAAALTFYSIFSLAPLLLALIVFAGIFFGQDLAASQLLLEIQQTLGESNAFTLERILNNAGRSTSYLTSFLGTAVMLYTISTFFTQLQNAMDHIWNTKSHEILKTLKKRAISFLFVMALGILFILSLFVSVMLFSIDRFLGYVMNWVVSLTSQVFFIVTVLLFCMVVYKTFTNLTITLKDTMLGAATTTLLLVAGKIPLSIYIRTTSLGTVYGTAGSVILLLLWIYFSMQIFLFGAVITKVYSRHFGSQRKHRALSATVRQHHQSVHKD